MVCGAWIRCEDVHMRHALFRAALLFAMLLPLQACGFVYKAEPIQAWVVDGETNQPLEGVIVVAHWQLKGGLEGGNSVGQMMVMETVTDAKGRFYFPGWGPKRSQEGRLKTQSPGILLFKSGYEFRGLENELNNETLRGQLEIPLKSDWDGKTIKMERFWGTMEEYAHNVYDLNTEIKNIYSFPSDAREECHWKKIPRMIVEIHRMSVYFDAKGVKLKGWRGGQHLDKISDLSNASNCGSADDFFRGYFQ